MEPETSTADPTTHGQPLRLAIGAIFKNEAPYILEWVAYHRVLGVDRFFIADNNSDDGSTEMLAALNRIGVVIHIPFPHVPNEAPQMPAYAEIMRRHRDDADWIAFIDADEFLFPTDDARSIRPFIEELDQQAEIGACAINWAVYGSSDQVEPTDGLVIDRFPQRGDKDWIANLHYKSVVRSKAWFSVHRNPHLFVLGKPFRQIQSNGALDKDDKFGLSSAVVWDRLRLNHYVVKSRHEFLYRKRTRGRATITTVKRDDAFFYAHDRNDFDDPSPAWLISATKAEMERLKALVLQAGYQGSFNVTLPETQKVNALHLPGSLQSIRGSLDSIEINDRQISITGWALTKDGGQVPYLVPRIGSTVISGGDLKRIARPDVVRNIPLTDPNPGYTLSFSLNDLPDNARRAMTVTVVGGPSKNELVYQVSGSKEFALPNTPKRTSSVSLSTAIRGFDFFREAALIKSKPKFEVIIDVGANTGQTITSLKAHFPDSRIFAFEPISSTFKRLQNNVSQMDGVTCFNLAVSSKSNLKLKMENSPGSVNNRIIDRGWFASYDTVTTVSGSDFCHDHKIKHVDFLKIDTEGHDLEVLKGFLDMFKSNQVGFVQVECGMNKSNKKHVTIRDIVSFFDELDYDMFGIYEQVRELNNGVFLRRSNVVMVSSNIK